MPRDPKKRTQKSMVLTRPHKAASFCLALSAMCFAESPVRLSIRRAVLGAAPSGPRVGSSFSMLSVSLGFKNQHKNDPAEMV
jgi:hypothetical protein